MHIHTHPLDLYVFMKWRQPVLPTDLFQHGMYTTRDSARELNKRTASFLPSKNKCVAFCLALAIQRHTLWNLSLTISRNDCNVWRKLYGPCIAHFILTLYLCNLEINLSIKSICELYGSNPAEYNQWQMQTTRARWRWCDVNSYSSHHFEIQFINE